MENKLIPFLRKYGAVLFFLVFTILAFRMLAREAWFDEVLTLQLVHAKNSITDIYFAYRIPNNHIVFSELLFLWTGILAWFTDGFPLLVLRLVPFACATTGMFVLWRILRRETGVFTAFFVCAALGLSPVFLLYATALRGYMTSFLLILFAFLSARAWLRRGGARYGLFYFLLSLAAVGTAPTNLAATGAIALYFLPVCTDARKRKRNRLFLLFALPVLAGILFYYPIRDQLLGCLRLGEGWRSASSAAWNFYVCAGLLFLPVLPFVLRGVPRCLQTARGRFYGLSFLAGILLPLGVWIVFRVPPFPRVFFPLFAVWILPLAFAAREGLRNVSRRILFLLPLGEFALLALLTNFGPQTSEFLFGDTKNDDLLSPYYARENFRPSDVSAFLREECLHDPQAEAFLTFDSDYPSILFASDWTGADSKLHFDEPFAPKENVFPGTGRTRFLVAEGESDMEKARTRFRLPPPVGGKTFGFHTVYRFEFPENQ